MVTLQEEFKVREAKWLEEKASLTDRAAADADKLVGE